MRETAALFLLVVLFLLAGCAGEPGSGAKMTVISDTAPSTPAPAEVSGLITDDELQPIVGAEAQLTGIDATHATQTQADGFYAFYGLPEGEYTLVVTHVDYQPFTLPISLGPAQALTQDVQLTLLPSRLPHNVTIEWTGHYDCGLEALILTGDCLILYEAAQGQPDPVTNETNYAFVGVGERWTQVVIELTWATGSQNQLDGMHLYAAAGNESQTSSDHHTKYAVAEGNAQPLRIDLFAGVVHETAESWEGTQTPAVLPVEGGNVMLLVYPRGRLADSGLCDPTNPSRCFLGVGAALDLDFTAYTTVFYNGPAPEGFSAMPA